MDIVLLLVGGLVAGLCGGLFGIGGGILIVPFLVLVMGFSQRKAQGTSLVNFIAPVGLLGVMEYYKKGEADIKSGALIALGFVFGAWLGSRVALGLPEDVMRKSFAVFLVAIGVYTFFRK